MPEIVGMREIATMLFYTEAIPFSKKLRYSPLLTTELGFFKKMCTKISAYKEI